MRWLVGFVAIWLGATSLVPARAAEGVQVEVGGEPGLDACAATAVVTGLAQGNGASLNVRAGPGLAFPVMDALRPGAEVIVCDERGEWQGIVYRTGDMDCGTGSPIPRRTPYAGPCRSGWVHGRYLELKAG